VAFDDPFAFGAVDAEGGDGHAAAIDQSRCAGNPDQTAPSPCADERTEAGFLKVKRKAISARTAPTINQHGLGSGVGDLRPVPILTVAYTPVIDHFPAQHLHKTIGNLTAAVETLINNQSG